MYRVIIGGNLARLSKESGMQKTRLPSATPDSDTILQSVKNTGLVCLKLIIVDIKYH